MEFYQSKICILEKPMKRRGYTTNKETIFPSKEKLCQNIINKNFDSILKEFERRRWSESNLTVANSFVSNYLKKKT